MNIFLLSLLCASSLAASPLHLASLTAPRNPGPRSVTPVVERRMSSPTRLLPRSGALRFCAKEQRGRRRGRHRFCLAVTRPQYAAIAAAGFSLLPKPTLKGRVLVRRLITERWRRRRPLETCMSKTERLSPLFRKTALWPGVPGTTAGLLLALEKFERCREENPHSSHRACAQRIPFLRGSENGAAIVGKISMTRRRRFSDAESRRRPRCLPSPVLRDI